MNAVADPIVIPDTDVTDETRYGIYERTDDGGTRRLAETSRDGIGIAIVTLMEERRADLESRGEPAGAPIIGILDRLERHWVTGLWPRGDHL